jgi:hypothetical protein
MSETRTRPDPDVPPGLPGWVKVFGIVVIILVLAFVILHLTGNAPANLHGALPARELSA